MEIKNILWPTDLSHHSAKALPHVNEVSKKFGSTVHLLYVVDDIRRFDHFYGDAPEGLLKGLQEAEFKSAEKLMQHVCEKDLDSCPAYVRHLRKGDPAQEILKLAEEENVDMIIMATQGAGASEDHRLYFGSVAEKVSRQAKIPVLAVSATD
jgi:nucleotide-binding universal stress UspA family protein